MMSSEEMWEVIERVQCVPVKFEGMDATSVRSAERSIIVIHGYSSPQELLERKYSAAKQLLGKKLEEPSQ